MPTRSMYVGMYHIIHLALCIASKLCMHANSAIQHMCVCAHIPLVKEVMITDSAAKNMCMCLLPEGLCFPAFQHCSAVFLPQQHGAVSCRGLILYQKPACVRMTNFQESTGHIPALLSPGTGCDHVTARTGTARGRQCKSYPSGVYQCAIH